MSENRLESLTSVTDSASHISIMTAIPTPEKDNSIFQRHSEIFVCKHLAVIAEIDEVRLAGAVKPIRVINDD